MRIKVIGIVVSIVAVILTRPVIASPRPFPDTRDGIAIFTDQLPSQESDAQLRFIATHYVGSQKMTRAWTRHMRTLAPDFLMLHYQLAVGEGPAAFVDGDRWVNDFGDVAKHEDWFLHDAHGKHVHQKDWNWDVMDIGLSGGAPKTGFPAFWVRTALQRMRDNECDGCFADSYTQDILMGQVQPPTPLFGDVAVTKRDWLPQLNRFGQYCAQAFHRQPERFKFLPNLGGLVTSWDDVTDLRVGDGAMNEGFCQTGAHRFYPLDDWKLQMTRVLSLAAAQKIVICQTGIDRTDADGRWFVVGAYLLTKGRRSYLNMMDKGSLEWYPEYGLSLGAYADEPKPDVAAYWDPAWRVFRRDYAHGFVLVNPSKAPVTIASLGKTFKRVTAEGGGPVGEDGRPSGALDAQPVTTVTIPAHSARVLLN